MSSHASLWVDTLGPLDLGPTAFRQVAPDVLVVGGGITGMTTALLLQRAGRRVAVVDATRITDSVTTHSTVKVTVGQGTVYSRIAAARGEEVAARYAQANAAGFAELVSLASSFDCDLELGLPHVVYAERPDEVEQLEREADVARRLGLPVSTDRPAPLPFDVVATLGFEDQAQFHPGRYLAGLARAFVAAGGELVEGVRVHGVDEGRDGCEIATSAGPLRAPHVVVATQYPFLDRGGHFAWLQHRRSYAVAGVLPPGTPAGMTINVGSPTHSTRTVRVGDERLLVVVGEGHEVGHVTETADRWDRLREWAFAMFGVREFRYHWSAEELTSLDAVPFVGFIAPGARRVLVATGFAGWGMTNGTASALLLRDLLLGQDNPWAAAFDARRAEASVPPVRSFLKQNLHVARTWLKDRVAGSPEGSPFELRPGEAAVLEVDGEQTAAFRDEQGGLHAVSAVCTHLGCSVEWNAGERSWDCPCHGSRFTCDGEVLHGPASEPLERREL